MTGNPNDNPLFEQFNQVLRQYMGGLAEERQAAIAKMQALGAQNDEATLSLLLDYLRQSENMLLRPLAASRLGEIGNARVVERLLALLESPDLAEDSLALMVQILGEIGHPAALERLENLLQNAEEEEVRLRSTIALGKIGKREALGTLSEAMQRDSSIKVRQHAIQAIGLIGDDSLIPELVALMQNEEQDKETRTFAAEALGRMGNEAALDPLISTLENQTIPPIVRYYAAYGLGLLGKSAARPALETATHDAHAWIAQMANESLAKLAD